MDHLFDALIRAHPDAVAEKDTRVVDVPALVARAHEAVDIARARLRAERRKAAAPDRGPGGDRAPGDRAGPAGAGI